MCTTTITQSELKKLLEYRDGKLYWKHKNSNRINVGDEAGDITNYGYKRIGVKGKRYQIHRLIWLYFNGSMPKNQVDHINHNRLDNRIENLREVTNDENSKNQQLRGNNTSGYTGVTWDKACSKWHIQITFQGKNINLGTFTDKEDAISIAYATYTQLGFHPNHGA